VLFWSKKIKLASENILWYSKLKDERDMNLIKDTFHALSVLAQDWHAIKTFVEHNIDFDNDVLHVWAGVLLQLGVASLRTLPVSSWTPWLAVFALEITNELSDFLFERWPVFAMQAGEGTKDVILTMFLPTVLLIIARRAPGLLRCTEPAL